MMRRLTVVFLATLVLLAGAAGGAPGAIAREVATPVSVSPHPVIGSWELRPMSADFPISGILLAVFTPEGGFLQSQSTNQGYREPTSPVGIGAWTATGERTADLTYWVMLDDLGDYLIVWMRIDVAPDGRTFYAAVFAEIMAGNGSVSPGQQGSIMGVRLAVEPFPPGALPPTPTPTPGD